MKSIWHTQTPLSFAHEPESMLSGVTLARRAIAHVCAIGYWRAGRLPMTLPRDSCREERGGGRSEEHRRNAKEGFFGSWVSYPTQAGTA